MFKNYKITYMKKKKTIEMIMQQQLNTRSILIFFHTLRVFFEYVKRENVVENGV